MVYNRLFRQWFLHQQTSGPVARRQLRTRKNFALPPNAAERHDHRIRHNVCAIANFHIVVIMANGSITTLLPSFALG
jgi:hypothetical protein